MLTITALHKSYATPQGPLPVLRGVDLHLAQGESLALMGESGSGKSTLLHLVAGLDHPDQGRIAAAGQTLSELNESALARWRRQGIGLIFQQFNLIASLSVADNLAFQARLAGRHDPHWQQRLAERLGLAALQERYPEQLSGGQQQRVALGRALASRPPLLLADEPTGNLDEASGDAALALLLELVAETGSSLLLVTHSARLASQLDRTLRLERGRLSTSTP